MSRRMKELAPGIEIVPKQTSATETWLWIGICAPSGSLGSERTEVTVEVGDLDPITTSLTQYQYAGGDRLDFFHGHVHVDGLVPATSYAASARPSGSMQPVESASCRFRTLPTSVGDRPLRLVAASCFDLGTDADHQLPRLCAELFAEEPPDMTLLLGDQVYLDAPWHEFRRRTKVDPRKFYLTKYWSAWGRNADGHGGLSPLLASGGNWFVPDDHEFWNNFPHATPLALHSMANWRNIVSARARRTLAWLRGRQIPDELISPPSTIEWDTWSRAAYELYGSFQTPAPEGVVSSGAGDVQHREARRPDVVQHVDVGDVRVILLDTRTQRSRSAKSPRSAFVPPEELDRLFELAAGPELVIIALAQPAFHPPTPYDTFAQKLKAFVDFDRGMENYKVMYPRFWEGLLAARSGKPTVFVGGDVHYNQVAVARTVGMAQIVSSPMSLVSGLAELTAAREKIFRRERRATELDIGALIPGTSGPVDFLVDHKANQDEGLSTIELSCTHGVYRLRVEHHRRDRAASGMIVELEIDPSAPMAEQFTVLAAPGGSDDRADAGDGPHVAHASTPEPALSGGT